MMKRVVLIACGLCMGFFLNTYSQTLEKKTFTGLTFEGVKTGSHGFVDVDNDGDLDLVIAGDSSKAKNFSLYVNNGGTGFTDVLSSSAVATALATARIAVNDAKANKILIAQYRDSTVKYFIVSDSAKRSVGAIKIKLRNDSTNIATYLIGSSVQSFFNRAVLLNYYKGLFGNKNEFIRIVSEYIGKATQKQDSIISVNESGLSSPFFTKGFLNASVFLGDIENDGYVDLIVTGKSTQGLRTYRNHQGVFEKHNYGIPDNFATYNLATPNINANFGDYDNDGDLDGFVNWSANVVGFTRTESDVYRNNGVSVSTRAVKSIRPKLAEGSSSLGDYDNDGFIDYFLTGKDTLGTLRANLYENTNDSVLFKQTYSLVGYFHGTSQFVDVDNDGDLDLFTAGEISPSLALARLYYNNNGFTRRNSDSTSFTGVKNAVSTYGDYDNDGDIDIFLAGVKTDNSNFSAVYKNTDGKFSSTYTFLRSTLKVESASFADVDKDSDLDMFITGTENGANGAGVSELYVNNNTLTNTAPTVPSGLRSVVIDSNKVAFIWNSSTDPTTPASGITYNIYIGSTTNKDAIRNSHSILTGTNNGFRKINKPGDIRNNFYSIQNLDTGVYKWSVQAIDGSLAASVWATEQTFTITKVVRGTKQPVSIGFTTPKIVKVFTDAPFTISVTNSSALPANSIISYSISDTQVATISGTTVTHRKAGFAVITALFTGATNYYGAIATASLEVRKVTQTIVFGALANKTFGNVPFILSATSSAGLPVSYSASNSLVSISNNTITIRGAGTVIITAYQTGNENYLPASATQILTIREADSPNKTTPTFTFSAIPNLTIGQKYTLVATSNSPVAITFVSSDTNKLSIVGNIATAKARGNVTITANQEGNTQYNSAFAIQNVTVLDPNLLVATINFTVIPNLTIGQKYTLVATSNSPVAIIFTTSDVNIATVSGNTLTAVATGTSVITANQVENAQFNPASARQTVIVNNIGTKAPLTSLSKESKDIAIYPNPSSHSIHINASKALGNGIKTYRLVTIKGQEVLKGSFTSSTSIDVRYQKAGTYILTIGDSEGNILQQSHVIIAQ